MFGTPPTLQVPPTHHGGNTNRIAQDKAPGGRPLLSEVANLITEQNDADRNNPGQTDGAGSAQYTLSTNATAFHRNSLYAIHWMHVMARPQLFGGGGGPGHLADALTRMSYRAVRGAGWGRDACRFARCKVGRRRFISYDEANPPPPKIPPPCEAINWKS